LRQERAEEKTQQALERKRQREEKTETKRPEKEEKQLEKEANQQPQTEARQGNMTNVQPGNHARLMDLDVPEEEENTRDEIIVALPATRQSAVVPGSTRKGSSAMNRKAKVPSSHKTKSKRPSLVVESDRDVVVAYEDLRRSQRNRKRPR
jgi:hypothetical protein